MTQFRRRYFILDVSAGDGVSRTNLNEIILTNEFEEVILLLI